MQNDHPFGGQVLFLGGDFRQIANVVLKGTNVDIIDYCIKSSTLWQPVKVLQLTVNMRTARVVNKVV